jgi:hypothetical protein
MNTNPNPWVQATPVCAFCLFLSHGSGAPDPDRSAVIFENIM